MRSASTILSPEWIFVLLVCAAASTPSFSRAADIITRSCGTSEPTASEAEGIQHDFVLRQSPGVETPVGGVIRVAFHVIHNGVEGNITDAQIQQQMAEINLDFSGADGGFDTGYRFVLASVDRTLDATWFDMIMGSKDEKRMKELLAVDPTHTINIYTARIQALGWSSFPWGVEEANVYQGIVIHYGSVPGGSIENFNMGRTATHEIGHYLGLFHTFFTGCLEPNDYVADTPAQEAATSGCPDEAVDTCPLPGPDPIHNYLDYSYDACYAEFTEGQDERMDQMTLTYRPNLITAPLAVGEPVRARIATLRPVVPNPSGSRVRLAFALRREARASLRVHDLSGRVVARLVDGVLAAGDYVRVFQAPASGSGVYFADLVVEGERMSRRVVVTR